jgi:hypothetical protein
MRTRPSPKPTSVLRVAGLFVIGAVIVVASQSQTTSPNPPQTPTQDKAPDKAQDKASVQAVNDAYVDKVFHRITDQQNEPASKAFKNIQLEILKNVPAKRFLSIMNFGYSRALGVTCEHCHDPGDFSSDAKRPKRAAREMAVMHRSVNEQLTKMQNLEHKPEERYINCNTCHRGAIDPNQR